MKQTALILALCLCLLCGCTKPAAQNTTAPDPEITSAASAGTAGATQPAAPETQLPQLPQSDDGLFATWVNAGQYSGGRDFVETLTINPDGTIRVHLDYQGSPYNDLSGTFLKKGDVLTFTMSDGTVRVYRYEVDANILTLTSDDRTVTYRRSD